MEDQKFLDICKEFDISLNNGLVIDNPKNDFQEYFLTFTKNKLGADAVFFYEQKEGPNVPLIYFKKFDYVDENEFAKLHKMAWNHGQAPLLFIILPTKVLMRILIIFVFCQGVLRRPVSHPTGHPGQTQRPLPATQSPTQTPPGSPEEPSKTPPKPRRSRLNPFSRLPPTTPTAHATRRPGPSAEPG